MNTWVIDQRLSMSPDPTQAHSNMIYLLLYARYAHVSASRATPVATRAETPSAPQPSLEHKAIVTLVAQLLAQFRKHPYLVGKVFLLKFCQLAQVQPFPQCCGHTYWQGARLQPL